MKKSFLVLLSIFILGSNLLAQPKSGAINDSKNLDEGLTELTDQISNDLSENQKRKIAVVEFVDLKGNVTDLGRYLSEKLITKLFQTKKIIVVERQQLNKVIAEQKLSLTGIIEPSAAQKLGRLLGVEAIGTGSISDLTKTIEINARLISTETGEVFAAASTQILKDETVCNLMGGCQNSNIQSTQNDEIKSKPTQTNSKSWKLEASLFTFELHKCTKSGEMVVCDFTITNNDVDRKLLFGGTAKLYDDFNNEVNKSRVELANDSGSSMPAVAFMVNGIPTKARLYFKGVSQTATKAVLIGIKVDSTNTSNFYIQFRNIPFEK